MPAMGDLFAPAYRANDPASVQAVNDWQNRVFNVNDVNIEQTRAPVAFNTGKPGGMLDPEALRVRAQGGPYDFGARRDAIAAQIAAQPRAAAPAQSAGAMPPYYGSNILGQNDWTTFSNAVGQDAANAWAQQQYAAQQAMAQQPPQSNWNAAVNSGVGEGGGGSIPATNWYDAVNSGVGVGG